MIRVFHDVDEIPDDFGPSAIAIGKFDGVHAGHRALMAILREEASLAQLASVAVTFDRNPLSLVAPERCPADLVGVRQKVELLDRTGIDATVVLTFDETLAAEEPESFVERVIVGRLRARRVLVGRDFRFGRGGRGDVALLRHMGAAHGFIVEVIADVADAVERKRVSSSWVRALLDEGNVARARELLGRETSLRGTVVHGLKRGRELGFPTANVSSGAEGFVPADGVYAGWLTTRDDGIRYPAAISVGTNPTFDDVPERQVEAYVLDQTDLDLYDREVDLTFTERIRGMVAFTDIPTLIAQIADDVERVREIQLPA